MPTLTSIPVELVCKILHHLEPIHRLDQDRLLEKYRWDFRHWLRTITLVARTCRFLRGIAVPLLYHRYEAKIYRPIIPFIDAINAEHALQRLKHVTIYATVSDVNIIGEEDYYFPTFERLDEYCAWSEANALSFFEQLLNAQIHPGEIELWRLLSRAPNLESLSIDLDLDHVRDRRWDGRAPLFLVPIVAAAQNVPTNSHYNGWFRQLRSLNLILNGRCGTYLVQLFSLPGLRSVCLAGMGTHPHQDWAHTLIWPEAKATSSVRDLSLSCVNVPAHIVLSMIDCCKALESFTCSHSYGEELIQNGHERKLYSAILDGLQHNRETLIFLNLKPWSTHPQQLAWEYKRVEGFQTLVALKDLRVPWHVLMGSPTGLQTSEGDWEPAGDWQYPAMRGLLPYHVRSLTIEMSSTSMSGYDSVEKALCGALPARNCEDHVLLPKDIDFNWSGVHVHEVLSLNLWRVQNAFQKVGCNFEYTIRLAYGALGNRHQTKSMLDELILLLAKVGPPGVQMGSRTIILGGLRGLALPRKVMDVLGLGEEWLDTEEAKEILFGEDVDRSY